MGVGAQPSGTVARLVGQFGVLPPAVHKRSVKRSIPKREREFSTAAEVRGEGEGSKVGEWLGRCIMEGRAPWAMMGGKKDL